MENFPQYKLWDFYHKHYYQGGLHIFQVQLMFEHVMERKMNDNRFAAALQGIDLDKELKKKGQKTQSQSLDDQQKKQELPLFRDPEEYKDLSQEERERLTQEMMSKHKNWTEGGNKSSTIGS